MAADGTDIDGDHARRLSAVDEVPEVALSGPGADGLDGQDATVGARDVGNAEGAGVGREEVGDAGEDLFWTGGEVEHFYGELVAFGAGEPGEDIADVFVIGGDDFVAGRERQTVADDIGALGGVAGEGEFARGGVDDASGLGFDLSPALVVCK